MAKDRQEIIAVLDLYFVGERRLPSWDSYRETIADALMALHEVDAPLLDEIAVRNKIAEWYGAEWDSKDSTFYETDDTGTKADPDEGAMHAYRGFKWTREQILDGES